MDTDFRTAKGAILGPFGKGGRMLEDSSDANKDSGAGLKSVRQTEVIGTEPSAQVVENAAFAENFPVLKAISQGLRAAGYRD